MKVEFYSDPKNKTMNSDLFSGHAEEWAKLICQSGLKNDKLEKNKISQIRKFYDEVLKFSEYLRSGDDYKTILPYIKMLNAKAAYAEGRKLVTEEFKIFIKQSLEFLTDDDPQAYTIFASFLEAFMGFYKFYDEKGNIQQNQGGRR
jgi:CRISPR-associated protein Csm2